MAPPVPVTRVDWALRELSNGILAGQFQPGERLKPQELAATWEVSPTPIREALQRLTATGLVQALPNRGMRVAPVVVDEIRELYSIRLLLEPFALRASLEARDDSWERGVSDAYDGLAAVIEAGAEDLLAFEASHREFHDALLSRSGSMWLRRIIDVLGVHSMRYRLLSLVPRGGWTEVLDEHRTLRDACLGADVDVAVELLFEHIRRTVNAVADPAEAQRIVAHIDAAGRRVHLPA